jgi:UDP-2,3-diacylglucosamine pyrophosphatase LpxH
VNERHVFVISDLHLGAGPKDDLEDFHYDELLATWLAELEPEKPTVVINGDFIDFAQIPPLDVPKDRELLWDEATSLVKLEVALEAHAKVFDALQGLIVGGGTLVLTVGNHDLDLAWSGVGARLRDRLGKPDEKHFHIETKGAFVDRGLHVEHGYYFAPENCPRKPYDFIHDVDGHRYLERVWGTDFVLRFYNHYEKDLPFIDNVKPALRVLMAGIRGRWIGVDELVRLGVFLKIGLPLRAIGSFMSDDAPPDELLLGAFEDPEWQDFVLEVRSERGDELVAAVEALSPEDRDRLRRTEPVAIEAETLEELTGETMNFVSARRERKAAKEVIEETGAKVVVFGHTHRVVDGKAEGGKLPQLFNPGSWVPKLRLDDPAVAKQVKGKLTKEILSNKALYTVDARAVHVVVDDVGAEACLEDISARHPGLSAVKP